MTNFMQDSLYFTPLKLDQSFLVPASYKPPVKLGFLLLVLLKQDQKVTLLHRDMYGRGYISIGKSNLWEFLVCNRDGNDITFFPIANIAYSWKYRIQENTFELGWQKNIARQVEGIGQHVSAALLQLLYS